MKLWDNTTFWGRVKEKADWKDIFLKDLAKEVGISQSTIFNYINLNQVPKKPETIQKIAHVLGVTENYLLHGTDEPVNDEPSEEEKRLLLYFSGLSAENKKAILQIMESLSM